MRHGETENNKNGIIQGSEVDSDINEIGDIQALKFYNSYKKICFDKVYVSALKRTYQTVKRFIDDGIPYESLKEFNEISWGENQGKSDDLEEYSELVKTWANGELNNKFKNGESPNETLKRLLIGFNKIISENLNNVLLCIHGRAMRILLSKIIDDDLTKMDKYIHSNTGLYIVDINKKKESKILKKDIRSHLY